MTPPCLDRFLNFLIQPAGPAVVWALRQRGYHPEGGEWRRAPNDWVRGGKTTALNAGHRFTDAADNWGSVDQK